MTLSEGLPNLPNSLLEFLELQMLQLSQRPMSEHPGTLINPLHVTLVQGSPLKTPPEAAGPVQSLPWRPQAGRPVKDLSADSVV